MHSFSACSLIGEVCPPCSKSDMQRLIFLSALADKPTELTGDFYSSDILCAVNVVESLGTKLEYLSQRKAIVFPSPIDTHKSYRFTIMESGLCLRFIISVILCLGLKATVKVGKRLYQRILADNQVFLPDSIFGIDMLCFDGNNKIHSDKLIINAALSSQFLSGFLMALPLREQKTTILVGEVSSSIYVKLSLELLKKYAIRVVEINNGYVIEGKQRYISPIAVAAQTDWSLAGYWALGGLISGEVSILGLDKNATDGNKYFVDVMSNARGNISYFNNKICFKKSKLQGFEVSVKNCPDLFMLFALAACCADGNSKIYDIARLTNKESDRLNGTLDFIKSLGVSYRYSDNLLQIEGGINCEQLILSCNNDHRMAMLGIIASCVIKGKSVLDDIRCIDKSYPNFIRDFQLLGGKRE